MRFFMQRRNESEWFGRFYASGGPSRKWHLSQIIDGGAASRFRVHINWTPSAFTGAVAMAMGASETLGVGWPLLRSARLARCSRPEIDKEKSAELDRTLPSVECLTATKRKSKCFIRKRLAAAAVIFNACVNASGNTLLQQGVFLYFQAFRSIRRQVCSNCRYSNYPYIQVLLRASAYSSLYMLAICFIFFCWGTAILLHTLYLKVWSF